MSASFLSPLAAFHMIYEKEHLMSAWRNVFYVTGFIAISTYGVYQIWGTGDVSIILKCNLKQFFSSISILIFMLFICA